MSNPQAKGRGTMIATFVAAISVGAMVVAVAPETHAATLEQRVLDQQSMFTSPKLPVAKSDVDPDKVRKVPMKHFDVTAHFGHSTGVHAGSGHGGVDLAATKSPTIRSASTGKVIEAGWSGGYGNMVVVKTPDGKKVMYAHMNSVAVKKGDKVKPGTKLGMQGSTGFSTGPHLHFEVRNKNDKPIDPVKFLDLTNKELAKAGR